MMAGQDKLESFVMDSAKAVAHDKNKEQESKSKTKTTRLTPKKLEMRYDSRVDELKRTSQRTR